MVEPLLQKRRILPLLASWGQVFDGFHPPHASHGFVGDVFEACPCLFAFWSIPGKDSKTNSKTNSIKIEAIGVRRRYKTRSPWRTKHPTAVVQLGTAPFAHFWGLRGHWTTSVTILQSKHDQKIAVSTHTKRYNYNYMHVGLRSSRLRIILDERTERKLYQ